MRITDGRAAVHLERAGRWPVAVVRYTAAGLCSERNLGKGHQLPLHNQPYHLEQGRTEKIREDRNERAVQRHRDDTYHDVGAQFNMLRYIVIQQAKQYIVS